jgi:hypothetical protein
MSTFEELSLYCRMISYCIVIRAVTQYSLLPPVEKYLFRQGWPAISQDFLIKPFHLDLIQLQIVASFHEHSLIAVLLFVRDRLFI